MAQVRVGEKTFTHQKQICKPMTSHTTIQSRNGIRLRSSDHAASSVDEKVLQQQQQQQQQRQVPPTPEFQTDEKKPKDRIKTLEQFGRELNLLMETKIKHDEKAKECKELTVQLKTLRARVLPFLLDNLKQTRANSAQHKMYISSTIVHRFRKVHIADVYEIIEAELGPANRKLIEEKAKELRKQKVAMRQTRIAPMSTKRADKRKQRTAEAAVEDSDATLPRKRAKKNAPRES